MFTKLLSLSLILSLILGPSFSFAMEDQPPTKTNRLQELSQQVTAHPTDQNLLYNYGVALYQAEQFAKAAEIFQQSAKLETDPRKRGAARYNQGRALFSKADKIQATTPQLVSQKRAVLEEAGAALKSALQDNPKLDQARQGLQQYRQAVHELDKQQQQQQQQKQKQKQEQGQEGQEKIQDKLDQASKKQQQLNKENSSKPQQPSQEQMNDMAAKQQQLREKLEELQKELNKNKEEGEGEQAKQLKEAIDQQKAAEESLKQGQAEQAKKQQEEAAKKLDEISKAANDTPEQTSEEQQLPPLEPEKNLKPHSLASDIIDNERKLHELRKEQLRHSRPYKGKDW